MSEPLRMPLTELVRRLGARELSPVELMQETLRRIDETNERLNAFVSLRRREELLAAARDAEGRYVRKQARTLEGVPFGVKDLEDVAGMVTSFGSRVFRENRAETNSIQVERLGNAGAIVVGKMNTPEFGHTAITKNPLFGATRNPWDLERSPGGSSGGASAAIAGGVIPLATASDGGGSIRIPASFTGCFGLKTSYGRVPGGPRRHWVSIDTGVYGPLTRTVADAALHMDAVVGPHPLDPNSLPHPGLRYSEILDDLPSPLRFAFSPDLGFAVVQSDVAESVRAASRAFADLGHVVEEIEGGPPEPGYDWGMSNAFELLGELEEYLPEREDEFGRAFLQGIRAGAGMTPRLWAEARQRRAELNAWCARILEDFDLLLTPTVPFDPPPARGPLPREVEGRPLPFSNVGGFTMPFNFSGHPAATVRTGLSRAGLPIGMQIVGPRHRDDLVLQAARAFEGARPWADRWPDL